jgi:hypothetical protein
MNAVFLESPRAPLRGETEVKAVIHAGGYDVDQPESYDVDPLESAVTMPASRAKLLARE